jgi:Uncharacterized conserved protein
MFLAFLVLLIIFLFKVTGLLVDFIWFGALGYAQIFLRLLLIRFIFFSTAFAISALYLIGNLWLLLRSDACMRLLRDFVGGGGGAVSRRTVRTVVLSLASIPALLFGIYFAEDWDTVLRFGWRTAFGEADPVFGHDIGFYLFTLPFLRTIQVALILLFTVGTLVVGLVYLHEMQDHRQLVDPTVAPDHGQSGDRGNARLRWQLALNVALLLATWAAGFLLDRYDLLTDASGAVYGAGYVDVNITRWAMLVAVAATLTFAAALVGQINRHRRQWLILTSGAYLVVLFFILSVIPGAVQRFVVEPNELNLEEPFLRRNISFTRKAYGLDRIEELSYDAVEPLSLASIDANDETINNIRLWDWRPLSQTFRQLQQIRTYYAFTDVDVDRYRVDDKLRQIMLRRGSCPTTSFPPRRERG